MSILPDTEIQNRISSLLEEWQQAEEDCIANCDKMLAATDNVLISAIIDIVRADSFRHKEILAMIGRAMTGEISVAASELRDMSGLIEEHLELERTAIGLALKEFETSNNVAVRQLLGYLLEDEKKHFMMMTQLIDYERLNPPD